MSVIFNNCDLYHKSKCPSLYNIQSLKLLAKDIDNKLFFKKDLVEVNGKWLIISPPSPPQTILSEENSRKLSWAEGKLTFFRVHIAFQITWEKWEWMILMSVIWYFSPNMRCQYLLETTQSMHTKWYSLQNRISSGWSLKPFVVTNDLFFISDEFAHLCICNFAMNITINVVLDIDGDVHTTPIVTSLYMQIKEKNKKSERIFDSYKKYISS